MIIRNVVVGWFNRIFGKNTTLYKKRMEVCETCPDKMLIGKQEWVCGICFCPLKSKLRVNEEVCAKGRW